MNESLPPDKEPNENSAIESLNKLIKKFHPDRFISESDENVELLNIFIDKLVKIRSFVQKYNIHSLNSWSDLEIEEDVLRIPVPNIQEDTLCIEKKEFQTPIEFLREIDVMSVTREDSIRALRKNRMPAGTRSTKAPESEPRPTNHPSPFRWGR